MPPLKTHCDVPRLRSAVIAGLPDEGSVAISAQVTGGLAEVPGRLTSKPVGRRAGTRQQQRASARGQRTWNGQPEGGSRSDGAMPGMPLNTPRRASEGRLEISMLRVGVAGRREDVPHRADLHEPARIHDADAVRELRHQAHVVPDEDDGRADLLLDLAERLQHLLLHDHVERAGRLVGDDDLRAQRDRHGDADALLHAAAELVRDRAPRRPEQDRPRERSADALPQACLSERRTPWPSSRSSIWARTLRTGLSELMAPCGMSEMRENRSVAQPIGGQAKEVFAVERTLPPVIRPGGRIMRSRARMVVDLPDPDSPTRPSRSPGESEKLTPATACTGPAAVRNSTRRSSTVSTSRAATFAASRPHVRCAHGGCHHVVLSRTLTMRSSPAEVSSSPMKMSAIITTGGDHHHQSPRRIAL